MSFKMTQEHFIHAGSVKTRYWTSGDGDSCVIFVHGAAGALEDWYSNSQLHTFENCGHTPMREYPEEFNRLVLDFLA